MLIVVVILLGFGAITLSLWVGGSDVIAGRLSGGDLSGFVFYAVIVATSGAGLSEIWGEVQRAAGAADRVAELLAETPAIRSPIRPRALPWPPQGRVELRDVVFRYPSWPDLPALNGISLAVQPGETVALVGPSGAGKTTVFQMLLRFYDPQSGAVCIEDVNVADADLAEVRGRIGLVPQDPVVFGTDIWENIRYGRPQATDTEIREAAQAASASGFIKAMPRGYAAHVGEKGIRLSGGQRQRLAIARAILRDAPILLLDEATSALDAESEFAVQRAFAELPETGPRSSLRIGLRPSGGRTGSSSWTQAGSPRQDRTARSCGKTVCTRELAELQFTDGTVNGRSAL